MFPRLARKTEMGRKLPFTNIRIRPEAAGRVIQKADAQRLTRAADEGRRLEEVRSMEGLKRI